MKKEARLSGLLLARKGKAAPSPSTMQLGRPAFEQFENAREYYGKSAPDLDEVTEVEFDAEVQQPEGTHEQQIVTSKDNAFDDAVETVKKLSEVRSKNPMQEAPERELVQKKLMKVKTKNTQIKKAVKTSSSNAAPKKAVGGNGRIAMTVRMEEAEHLRLRIFAAHSKTSCQEILTKALDFYLEHDPKAKELNACAISLSKN